MSRAWSELEEAFAEVISLEKDDRIDFLERLRRTDRSLHDEIVSLLEADDQAGEFINKPLVSPVSLSRFFGAVNEDDHPVIPHSTIGKQIGAYRIEREIGRGGMGEVFLATRSDGAFTKKVAVKLIRQGIDSDFNIRRFRHERQILASLNHPNIAALMDGGTTEDGLPYLIMEYVEGEPLLKFCERENLDLKNRLRLFEQICAAVAHAHQLEVIHRDIKPGNILVDRDGVPKLLDFGIAKILSPALLDEQTGATHTLLQQMTPEYASPEQINGETVSYSSDVYSLGVVLYELVAGERPYKFKSRSPYEIARVVNEESIPALRLKNEGKAQTLQTEQALERIILKALHKKPQDRYPSVAAFSGDIGRLIADAPVPAETFQLPSQEKTLSLPSAVKSIAVKPFTLLNTKGDAKDASTDESFLGIGLADALTSRLSRVRQFAIRPTSSVLQSIQKNSDSHAFARDLNVDYVLEGSIWRSGAQIRVNVQLFSVSDDSVVWAAQFDESETDIFRLQDSIAEKTAASLVPQLSSDERERLGSGRGTTNSAAYEAYLRGRFYWLSYTAEGIFKSEEFFRRAVALDSQFALAYSGLADFYNWQGVIEIEPPADSFELAKKTARRAVELDPNLAEAHASLAFALWAHDWDAREAERLYRKALEINPNYAKAHEWYAYLLSSNGRHDEAIDEMRLTERLDPRSPAVAAMFSFCLYNARRFSEGLQKLYRALELDPNHYLALQGLGWVCPPLGKYSEAVEGCRKALAISDALSFNKFSLASALAVAGEIEEARKITAELEARRRAAHVPAYYLALIYTTLDEIEKAFFWLDTAIEERGYWTQWLRVESRFDPLRADPRFAERERKIKPLVGGKITGTISVLTTDSRSPSEESGSRNEETLGFLPKSSSAFAGAVLLVIILASVGFFALRNTDSPKTAPASIESASAKTVNTLVVLPFEAENGKGDSLGISLADELKRSLGRFKKLSVLSAGSIQDFSDIKRIGCELKADFILRGRLQPVGGKTQLTAELLDAASGEILWKEKFAAESGDLPRLQGQMSERVLNALAVELSNGEREFVAKSYTDDSQAFEFYLAGRHQLAARSKEGTDKALENFARAVALDSQFALAYSGLADAHLLLAHHNPPPLEGFYEKAEKYAAQALSLDPEIAEAHTSLAMATLEKNNDAARAEKHFRRAIEINPSSATAHHWFAVMLTRAKKTDEAIKEIKIAVELDPRSAIIQTAAGTIHGKARLYDEASSFLDKAIEIERGFVPAYVSKSLIRQQQGDYRGAVETYSNVKIYGDLPGSDLVLDIMTAQEAAASGNRQKAFECLERILRHEIFKKDFAHFSPEIAQIYNLLGELEQVFDWFTRMKGFSNFSPDVYADPRFDNLRADPRFADFFAGSTRSGLSRRESSFIC